MDTPGIHHHKIYGMVFSQVPWKSITQSKKSPKYERNLSLLKFLPAKKQVISKPKNKNFEIFTVYKKKNTRPTSQASSAFKVLKPRYSVSSSNSSIDIYKQMGMKNIRNYLDSEDDDAQSACSHLNSSFVKNNSDLALIDESRYTHPSSLNMSVVVRHQNHPSVKYLKPKLQRQTYSLSKLDLKFK